MSGTNTPHSALGMASFDSENESFPLYPQGAHPGVFWVPKPPNMDKGIWDPKPRVAYISGTNLKSLKRRQKPSQRSSAVNHIRGQDPVNVQSMITCGTALCSILILSPVP